MESATPECRSWNVRTRAWVYQDPEARVRGWTSYPGLARVTATALVLENAGCTALIRRRVRSGRGTHTPTRRRSSLGRMPAGTDTCTTVSRSVARQRHRSQTQPRPKRLPHRSLALRNPPHRSPRQRIAWTTPSESGPKTTSDAGTLGASPTDDLCTSTRPKVAAGLGTAPYSRASLSCSCSATMACP